MSDQDLFKGADPAEDPNKDYLVELVGEDKKFKTPQDLARGKYEADRFILQLQKEAQELREDLGKRLTMEELVDKMDNKINSKANTQPYQGEERDESTPTNKPNNESFSREDVDKLVSDKLADMQKNQVKERNAQFVEQKLKEAFGDNYATIVNEKVKQLGTSPDFLRDMIGTHPNAFLKLVEADKPQQAAPAQRDLFSTPTSSVNSSFSRPKTPGGHKTEKEWAKFRKDNPRDYFDPNVANQRMKDLEALGDDYFK